MTFSKRTLGVHAATKRSQFGELSEAIFLTQGFDYPSAEAAEARFQGAGEDEYIYARYGNPTVAMFEQRMAILEGTEDGFATASGMAAVSGALISMLKAGDHVVSSRALFGSCLYVLENILARYGVEVTFVDGRDLDAWEAAIRPDTKVVFFESMSNPTLEVIDIEGVCKLAHAHGATVVVDNVFSTPTYSDAVAQGADVVVYSATKHIDGQGRGLAGIILGTKDMIRGTVEPYMKHTGGALSPFNAWMMLKGLETMDLRVRAQTASAVALADALAARDDLDQMIYPGHASHPQHDLVVRQLGAGGTMIAIDVGTKDRAFQVLNSLQIAKISNNLGDAKTIVTHPSTTTHERLSVEQKATLGITDGLIRVSVGIEDPGDLITDFTQALNG
ncbi:MAG: O-succinylhomoserine sulfhydrylase [Planktomarina sp.]